MAERLAVLGSGGHAKVVIEAALARAPERQIILLDDSPAALGKHIFGIGVSGTRDDLDSLRDVAVALGIGDNRARFELLRWLGERGKRLETLVHPSAVVAPSVDLGAGAFVGAGAVIIGEARIGAGAIINTCASVDHDCAIAEAAHIAPGVRLCGNVEVGERTLLGVGTAVRPGIKIAADVVAGAGSVIVRDIRGPGTYVGNPARRLDPKP